MASKPEEITDGVWERTQFTAARKKSTAGELRIDVENEKKRETEKGLDNGGCLPVKGFFENVNEDYAGAQLRAIKLGVPVICMPIHDLLCVYPLLIPRDHSTRFPLLHIPYIIPSLFLISTRLVSWTGEGG
nr:hypothetical protein L204_03915 [Cryptococcus depauperatus CBS 7855]